MKNIYLIPTHNKSLLTKNNLGELRLLNGYQYQEVNENQNMYITYDDEIKVGDWYLFFMSTYTDLMICQEIDEADRCNNHPSIKYSCVKIVMTTDTILIQDGIKDIPKQFLKHYINNQVPYVSIMRGYDGFGGFVESDEKISKDLLEYRIRYPLQVLISVSKPDSPPINLLSGQITSGIEPPFEQHYKRKMVKMGETLEDATKDYCIKKYSVWVSDSDKSKDFIAGAKWQQEQIGKFCNNRIREYLVSKTKFIENHADDWIEIPDYKISALKEVLSILGLPVHSEPIF